MRRVRDKIGEVADAVIVGSRIVKEIESHAGSEAEAVGALVKELKDVDSLNFSIPLFQTALHFVRSHGSAVDFVIGA